jgi:hypothetical protein
MTLCSEMAKNGITSREDTNDNEIQTRRDGRDDDDDESGRGGAIMLNGPRDKTNWFYRSSVWCRNMHHEESSSIFSSSDADAIEFESENSKMKTAFTFTTRAKFSNLETGPRRSRLKTAPRD